MEAARESAEKRIQQIFQKWDVDGSGYISVEEMDGVLSNLGIESDRVHALFAAADANEDGQIDYSEFVAWICSSSDEIQDIRQRLETTRVFELAGATGTDCSTGDAITSAELQALRRLSKPTDIVRRTLEAMCLILNVTKCPAPTKPPSFAQVLRVLNDRNFTSRLRNFDLDSLRNAPALTTYLVAEYFGPGGESPPERLANGQETLTYRRVQRASRTVAALFKWCCVELIDVGAMTSTPLDELEEPPEFAELDEEEVAALARKAKNSAAPELSGVLASLPCRETLAEPHQVLFLAMAGKGMDAARLAKDFDKKGPCDRCDGSHHALDCPHFGPHKGHKAWTPRSRGREDHEDAWLGLDTGDEHADAADHASLRVEGRVVRQPGDGSCLYHSLSYGLRDIAAADDPTLAAIDGPTLRREIAAYLESHADDMVAGTAFRDYIWWDHHLSVEDYVKKMSKDGVWGGAIEMAACARMYNVKVFVFVSGHSSDEDKDVFDRVAAFGEDSSRQALTVCYMLRCHYDALVVSS